MANLTESANFDANVYRIDALDPVQGWNGSSIGISNQQAQALANRTQWLKSRVDLGPRVTSYTNWAPSVPSDLLSLTPTDLLGKFVRVNVSSYDAEVLLPDANAVSDGGNLSISCEPGANHQFLNSNGRVISLQAVPGNKIVDLATGNEVNELVVNPYTVVHVHRFSTTQYLVWTSTKVEDCPPGMIMVWPVNSPPYGWLECNGAAISRSVYSALFANIGLRFGNPGSTQFNLPDLRGEFIRGWDNGRGVDTNIVALTGNTTNGSVNVTNLGSTVGLTIGMAVSGTGIPVGATIASIVSGTAITISANATATGTAVALTFSGRIFGSYQADSFKSHFHIMKKFNRAIGTGAGFFAMDDNGTDGSENTEATGGTETRPRNIAMMYCIKY